MPPRKPIDIAAKLDALDDKLHDLLMKRGQLGSEGSPARLATRLRRLAARHKGEMPLATLFRLWREMSTVPGLPVHVYSSDRAGLFRDLARDFFGSGAAMRSHLSATAIVHECTGDPAAFGVVPPPESDENARAWWAQLTPAGRVGPRVVAALPFIGNGVPLAYVIGTLDLEASGSDTTLLLLEAEDSLSLTKLQSLLKQGGFESRQLAVSRDAARSATRYHLIEIGGFLTPGDSRLGTLREQGGDGIHNVAIVGSYANPITEGSVP